jgi:ceramide glucosyltransferase
MTAAILLIVLLACCVISCSYWLVALACLHAVMRPRRTQAKTPDHAQPFVSILKPVKGLDTQALENFASFCLQDYPQFELLFGVEDDNDPAVEVVRQLRGRFPDRAVRLVICEPLGSNAKAANLHALAAEAGGEILVISDGHIRVTPEYLRRVVAPLRDPKIGLVTCLYRGDMPGNLAAQLQALHMDATFAPSVALAWKLGTQVGLGATLVMRRSDLARSGGYAAIADYLLDDFEIAVRIARLGLRVHLSDYPVASVLGSMRFAQQWSREVRWSRGIRAADPYRYPGLPITFSILLALAAAGFSGIWPWAWTALPLALAVRWLVAWRAAMLLGQPNRCYLAWLPLRDLLSTAVWAASMVGRKVKWRGREFVLRRDGTLQTLTNPQLPHGPLPRAIRYLDATLRRRQGIFEFCQDARCVLRVNVGVAETELEFSDGSIVHAGDPVGILHLWNEHLPLVGRKGPDLHWGVALTQAIHHSMAELAGAAARDPRLRGLRAFGGMGMFISRKGDANVARMAGRFGFEWFPESRRRGIGKRIHEFGENILIVGLQWVFNPGGLRGKPFSRPREPLWISRQTLMKKRGPASNALKDREFVSS